MDFTYSSDVVLRCDVGAPAILCIAITEYVIIAVLLFLVAAHDSPISVLCVDSWMAGNGRGVLVSQPSGIRGKFDDIGFSKISVVVVSILSPP